MARSLTWVGCIDHDAGGQRRASAAAIAFSGLQADAEDFEPVESDPLAFNSVQYTSGTTSRPKGVVWTHANALWGARSNAAVCAIRPEDIGHVFLPLYHTNALSYSHLSTLWAGATMVLQPRFSASRYWDCVIEHQCSWGIQIPFSLKALMSQPHAGNALFHALGSGCARPGDYPSTVGIPCIGWFGMTETVACPSIPPWGCLPGK